MNSYLKTLKFARELYPLLNQGHKLGLDEVKTRSLHLRETLQNLGPTYIKFGQILSTRYDLLHYETCQELQKLLDSGEPLPFSTIFKILREQLGYRLENEFRQIDPHPIAVASLGQVHLGYLKNGQKVAIKVQKPGIHEIIRKDISAIKKLLTPANLVALGQRLSIKEMIKEFETWTYKELDYSIEATNTEKFAKLLESNPHTYVPKVYRNLLTDKVLVTEFIEGISIKEVLSTINSTNEDIVQVKGITFSRSNFIQIGKDALYKQIFQDGFFHADPHPSNIIIMNGNRVAFIDFGIVGRVNQNILKLFKDLLLSITSGNNVGVMDVALELDQIKETKADTDKLIDAISDVLSKYENACIEECSTTKAIFDLAFKFGQIGIEFPPNLILMFKVLATYEGIIHQFDPKINLLVEMKPLVEEEIISQSTAEFSPAKVGTVVKNLYEVASNLPHTLNTVMSKIEQEGIKVTKVDTSVSVSEQAKTQRFELSALAFLSTLSLIALVYLLASNVTTNLFGINVQLLFAINWAIISTMTLFYILKD